MVMQFEVNVFVQDNEELKQEVGNLVTTKATNHQVFVSTQYSCQLNEEPKEDAKEA
jgi:hypothetical protein